MNYKDNRYQNDLYLMVVLIAMTGLAGYTVNPIIFHNPFIAPVLIFPAYIIAKYKDVNTTMIMTLITIVASAFVARVLGNSELMADFNSPLLWAFPKILALLISYYFVNYWRVLQIRKNKENDFPIMIGTITFVLIANSLFTFLVFQFTATHWGY